MAFSGPWLSWCCLVAPFFLRLKHVNASYALTTFLESLLRFVPCACSPHQICQMFQKISACESIEVLRKYGRNGQMRLSWRGLFLHHVAICFKFHEIHWNSRANDSVGPEKMGLSALGSPVGGMVSNSAGETGGKVFRSLGMASSTNPRWLWCSCMPFAATFLP